MMEKKFIISVSLLFIFGFVLVSSSELQLTCPDTAKRSQARINNFFNCTPYFVPETQTVECHGAAYYLNHLYGIYTSLVFRLLEKIPNDEVSNVSTRCVGLYNLTSNTEDYASFEQKDAFTSIVDFDSLLAVGVLTSDREDWNCERDCNIRMLSDILELQIFSANFTPWLDIWNFNSSLFGTKQRWLQGLSIQAKTESIPLYNLDSLRNTSIQRLSFSGLRNDRFVLVRDMPLLSALTLDSIKNLPFQKEMFTGTPEVKYLLFRASKLDSIPTTISLLPNLQNLTYIGLHYNEKFDIPTKNMSTLSKLESLNIIHVNLFPISGKLPILPTLKKLVLRECRIVSLSESDMKNLPGLKELDLSGNRLTVFGENTFYHQQQLEFLDLSRNKLRNWPILYNCSLQFLNLSQNVLILFKNLGNTGTTVEFLNVSGNKIAGWDDRNIFSLKRSSSRSHLKDLNLLDFHQPLEHTQVSRDNKETDSLSTFSEYHVISNTLETSTEVVKERDRYFSAIRSSISGTSETIAQRDLKYDTLWLRKLDLSNNSLIKGLTEIMVESVKGLDQLDLGGNRFDCADCHMIPFQKWLNSTSTNVTDFGFSDPLVCYSPPINAGSSLVTVQFDEEPCLEKITSIWILVGVPLGIVFMLISIGSGVVYNYRSPLTYVLHLYKIRARAKKFSKTECNKYAFDAFICYSSHDRRFVLTQLAPLLENGPERYVICLHERDFPLGSRIVENIVGSIQYSRKTIIVLSEHFIKSKWCKWELEMANHKMFHDDEHFLILIQLEKLDRSKLERHLLFFMDTRTFLEWPPLGHKEEKNACKRLKEALGPSIFQETNERAPLLSDVMEDY